MAHSRDKRTGMNRQQNVSPVPVRLYPYLYEQEHNFSAFQQLQDSLSGEGTTNLAEVCQAAAVHEPLRESCNCGN